VACGLVLVVRLDLDDPRAQSTPDEIPTKELWPGGDDVRFEGPPQV